jgi:hypothetical protein
MSQSVKIIERPISREEGQGTPKRTVPVLAVSMVVVLILAAVVAVMIPGSDSVKKPLAAAANLSANPELMVTMRYAREAANRSGASDLAANPELVFATRFSEESRQRAENSFLATNPELMVLRRHGPLASNDANPLAANPELACYQRYIFGQDG